MCTFIRVLFAVLARPNARDVCIAVLLDAREEGKKSGDGEGGGEEEGRESPSAGLSGESEQCSPPLHYAITEAGKRRRSGEGSVWRKRGNAVAGSAVLMCACALGRSILERDPGGGGRGCRQGKRDRERQRQRHTQMMMRE